MSEINELLMWQERAEAAEGELAELRERLNAAENAAIKGWKAAAEMRERCAKLAEAWTVDRAAFVAAGPRAWVNEPTRIARAIRSLGDEPVPKE